MPIKILLHWGPGGDQVLRQRRDIRWPKIHRDVTLFTMTCHEFQEPGKSSKPLLKRTYLGKLPRPDKIKDEIAIEFAGPIKIARNSKISNSISRQ